MTTCYGGMMIYNFDFKNHASWLFMSKASFGWFKSLSACCALFRSW